MRRTAAALGLLAVSAAAPLALIGSDRPGTAFTVSGVIQGRNDVSAIGFAHGFLVLGSDEGHTVHILKRDGNRFTVLRDVVLPGGAEIDVEGIACDGDQVHVLGSHSLVRSKLKPKDSLAANRARLLDVRRDAARDQLFRFRLGADGTPGPLERLSLRPLLEREPLLRPFCAIPGKENGVDLEGIAARGGVLHIGFRGPVLRDNYLPVLKLTFDRPEAAELLFVHLGGLGVRDLAAVSDGILILAGPVGSGPGPFQLWHWNGVDCLPGAGRAAGRLALLGEVPRSGKGHPEGVAVLAEGPGGYDLLLAYDGLPDGGLRTHRVRRP